MSLIERFDHRFSIGLNIGRFLPQRAIRIIREPIGGRKKRAIDLLVLALIMPLMLSLIAIVALAIFLTDRGPIFYGHKRVGFDGRPFRCWKLRSMVTNGDEVLSKYLEENPQHLQVWQTERKLDDDPRVTRIGAILRKTSLDELPQVFNVLMGDMSLVGPRPVVVAELDHYASSKVHYLRARPGVTGLWQVSGRSDTTYKQRVNLDRYYVTNWQLKRDMWILFMTVPAVLASRGAK